VHVLRLAPALSSSLQLLHEFEVRRLPAEATDRTMPDWLLKTSLANGERLPAAAAENARVRGVEVDATVCTDPTLRVGDLIVDEARRVGQD
jgi:hypothetical protein